MSNKRANSFFKDTQLNLKITGFILGRQIDTLIQPYQAPVYQGYATLYPVANTINCLMNAGRIVYGGLCLIEAIFNDPKTSVPQVLGGIGLEIGALVANAINTALSLISLVTRTLATIFTLGYLPKNEYGRYLPSGRLAFGDEVNPLTLMNMWDQGMLTEKATQHPGIVDEILVQTTLSF